MMRSIELVAFTNAPADGYLQNIINWGRYAELFRYDSGEHRLLPVRARSGRGMSSGAGRPAAGVSSRRGSGGTGSAANPSSPERTSLASFA